MNPITLIIPCGFVLPRSWSLRSRWWCAVIGLGVVRSKKGVVPMSAMAVTLRQLGGRNCGCARGERSVVAIFIRRGHCLPTGTILRTLRSRCPALDCSAVCHGLCAFIRIKVLRRARLGGRGLFQVAYLRRKRRRRRFVYRRYKVAVTLRVYPVSFFRRRLRKYRVSSRHFRVFNIYGGYLATK